MTRSAAEAMDVTATLHGFDESQAEATLADEATVRDLLQALDIPTETVVVFLDDRPVPVEETLAGADKVRIVRIVSGG